MFYQFPSTDPFILEPADPSPYFIGDRSDPMIVAGDSDLPASRSVMMGEGERGGGGGGGVVAAANPLSVSKFQQQLSGEWNQRVLRRDKYNTDLSPNSFINNDSDSDSDDSSFNSDSDDSQWSLFAPTPSLIPSIPGTTTTALPIVESIPAEVSAFDGTSSIQLNNNNTAAAADDDDDTLLSSTSTSTLIVNSELFHALLAAVQSGGGSAIATTTTAAGLQVLQELDADYLALRTKLLRYLTIATAQQQQQQTMEAIPITAQQETPTQSASIDHTNSSSSSSSVGALDRGSPKKTYWPAKSYARR